MDTTDTRNRRQRIDDAEGALQRAFSQQADAEAKSMKAAAEAELAQGRVIDATKATDAARVQMADALAYADPPAPILARAPLPASTLDDDMFDDSQRNQAVSG